MNDYSRFHSVSDMMSELGIEPLSFRRRIARLTNFYKARGGSPCNPGTPTFMPGHPVLPSYQQEQLHPNISEKRLLSELLCTTNNKRLELITRDYYRYHRNQALQRSNQPALPQINRHQLAWPYQPCILHLLCRKTLVLSAEFGTKIKFDLSTFLTTTLLLHTQLT